MKCDKINKKIIFYIEGDLDQQESNEIKEHLKSCTSCRNIFDMIKQSLDLIENEKDIKPNPFAKAKLEAKIESVNKKEYIKSYTLKKALKIAAILIIGLLATFTGIKLGDGYFNNTDKSAEISEYQYYAQEYYLDDISQEIPEDYVLNINDD